MSEKLRKQGKISATDQAYQLLKSQIINLEIEPGTPLTEDAISQSLGVSRTPTREALRMLERDRLVTRSHNKGFVVRGISEEDMREMLEIRAVLEGWAAGKAAEMASDSNIKVMEEKIKKAQEIYETGNRVEFDKKSNEIHDIIAFVVNNNWYNKVVDDLSGFTISYKKLAAQQIGQLENAHEEHKEILEAIKSRDSQLASQLMIKHINSTRDAIVDALKNPIYQTPD